jgi:mono/diheme cytochrome c family protein/plastocyanin
MNTSKQINVMVLLVFAAVIATAAYTLWDPSRATQAKDSQLERTVDRGAYLFSQNCRACHGNSGEGGQASSRLPQALVLDRFDLQGKKTPDGPVDKASKDAAYKLIVNTLTCGRVGKYMPAWSIAQGGTLTDEQIAQLATFITEGTGWSTARDYAIHGYHEFHITGDISEGITLVDAVSPTDTVLHLSNVTSLGKGTRIQMGENLDAPKADDTNEIMVVTETPDATASTVTVERHVGITKAVGHEAGTPVLKTVAPADPPTITGSTGPVCGQYPPPPAPTAAAGASPTAAAASTELTLVAKNLLFDTSTLTGVAGKELTITLDNQDPAVPHNVHFFAGADATAPSVGNTEINSGPLTETLKIGPLDPGTYYYQCDVHPTTMFGTLTVQ